MAARVRHVDESGPDAGGGGRLVEGREHHVVAHERAGGVGEGCRDPRGGDRRGHRLHGKSGEVRGGGARDDRVVEGLIADVVGDPRVREVDGDPLRGEGRPSAREADGNDDIGGVRVDQRADAVGGRGELHRQHVDDEPRRPRPPLRDEAHGIPGRVGRIAGEGLEAREEDRGHPFLHTRSNSARMRSRAEAYSGSASKKANLRPITEPMASTSGSIT